MPRIIQTNPDGSPISNYLTQSPNTPFTVGKILSKRDKIYGYSGVVNFDISASASYPLMSFTLETDAIIRAQFSADYNVLISSGNDIGWQVSIDGIVTFVATGGVAGTATRHEWAPSPVECDFYLPSGRNCSMVVLNPTGTSDLVQANATIIGEYI